MSLLDLILWIVAEGQPVALVANTYSDDPQTQISNILPFIPADYHVICPHGDFIVYHESAQNIVEEIVSGTFLETGQDDDPV